MTPTDPTPADLPTDLPTDLADRYGAASPRRRGMLVGATALVAAVFLGWVAWTAFFHSSPTVSSKLIGWEVVSQHEATARVHVSLDGEPDEIAASCRLTAFAEDHATVGELAWTPVDGPAELVVRTERAATSIELLGCTAEGQPRPR